MMHKGSCHCGRIAFEVEGEIGAVIECNCSICARKGSLLWFVPRENVRCLEGVDPAALQVKAFDGRSL